MSSYAVENGKKVTVRSFREKKEKGEPIAMLTAYDYPVARALDLAGIDSVLVGDSLGMVVLGYENTLPVTMDEMIHHCKAVARGATRPLLIGDMPFLSYQTSPVDAVRNAGRFLQEAGMEAVKLEGGHEMLPAIQAVLEAGIPVLGHLGLTPQSVHKFGGMRPQARSAETARKLLEDALLLEQTGVFAIVLESIPARLAELVSKRLSIPTIGIGAGSACDGQVLVTNDMLGLYDRFTPRFVKQYANLLGEMDRAFQAYRADVQSRSFPAAEHTTDMADEEWEKLSSPPRSPSPGQGQE
ncbi:MAG: 3-methyl-2-oxobutanoate hydroxymethyltransferase, partial [Anaerolineales bacterium]